MWRKKTTECKSYYYSKDSKLFEQSLDVYKPISVKDEKYGQLGKKNLPTVLLVVGSGWVGHRAFIYVQTSWWNSSGPQTIAGLGCTCVCIRHRGAFCVLPSAFVVGQYLALLLAVMSVVVGWQRALVVTTIMAVLVALLAIGGRGSATFDDMEHDVLEALLWVDTNRDLLQVESSNQTGVSLLKEQPSTSRGSLAGMTKATSGSSGSAISLSDSDKSNHNTTTSSSQINDSSQPPLVFGGYSSGGHVAATLLQQPELFSNHGLPRPDKLFQGVLMISGVLAVRPESVTLESNNPKQKEGDNSSAYIDKACTTIATPQGPRWPADLVVQMVWGPQEAPKISSPLVQQNDPKLPHLLVGCRNELFGLSWLNVFFCSRAYTQKVQAVTGKSAKYVQVESDHWNILNSTALRDALQDELPKLVAEHTG